jgi:hypothetical protein
MQTQELSEHLKSVRLSRFASALEDRLTAPSQNKVVLTTHRQRRLERIYGERNSPSVAECQSPTNRPRNIVELMQPRPPNQVWRLAWLNLSSLMGQVLA